MALTASALLCGYAISPAKADADIIVAKCGPSTARAYVAQPRQGWIEDGLSGALTIVRDNSGAYDVVIARPNDVFSARKDGAKVIALHERPSLVLIVAYPLPVVEVYQLSFDGAGAGTLIWTNVKNIETTAGQVNKGAVFTANCTR